MSRPAIRVGFLGPEGTFTHEAALAGTADLDGPELIGLPTIFNVVMDVANGRLDRGIVPIENSIEGSVSATLDALAMDVADVLIVGEQVHAIEQCLIAATPLAWSEVRTVMSHPQASAQCAHFLRDRLGWAEVISTSSTADAVRMVAERGGGWAALGPRLAAERYGCVILADGVEDRAGNETRFVWLSTSPAPLDGARRKTSLVFWGDGSAEPGWLVRCLSELAERGVNMTRIESRPRKDGLGLYMFFVDCEGGAEDPAVAAALSGLERHVERLRVLGSYPVCRLRQA